MHVGYIASMFKNIFYMDVSYLNNASLSFSFGIESSLSHHVTIVAPCIYIYIYIYIYMSILVSLYTTLILVATAHARFKGRCWKKVP